MPFLHLLRLRALAILLGTAITSLALISLAALPAVPVIGVAVATVLISINQLTKHLTATMCTSCKADLVDQPAGEHGVICPACGSLNQRFALALPQAADDDEGESVQLTADSSNSEKRKA